MSSDSLITAAYKTAMARDMARQLKGFTVICRCLGWNAIQEPIVTAHERLTKLSRQNAWADTDEQQPASTSWRQRDAQSPTRTMKVKALTTGTRVEERL